MASIRCTHTIVRSIADWQHAWSRFYTRRNDEQREARTGSVVAPSAYMNLQPCMLAITKMLELNRMLPKPRPPENVTVTFLAL